MWPRALILLVLILLDRLILLKCPSWAVRLRRLMRWGLALSVCRFPCNGGCISALKIFACRRHLSPIGWLMRVIDSWRVRVHCFRMSRGTIAAILFRHGWLPSRLLTLGHCLQVMRLALTKTRHVPNNWTACRSVTVAVKPTFRRLCLDRLVCPRMCCFAIQHITIPHIFIQQIAKT